MLNFEQVFAECFAALTDDYRIAQTDSPTFIQGFNGIAGFTPIPSPRSLADRLRFNGSPFPSQIDEGQYKHIFRAFVLEVMPLARTASLRDLPFIKLNQKRFNHQIKQCRDGLMMTIINAYYNSKSTPMWWPILRGTRSNFFHPKKPGQYADKDEVVKYSTILAELCFDALRRHHKMPKAWRTETVLNLLKSMRATEDFTGFPILADALMEAGCEDQDLLDHCRSNRRKSFGGWIFKAVGMP